jgi:hypothetical protein
MGCLPRNEAHSALHRRKALLLGYIWCPDKAARDEHVNTNPADFLYLCNRPFLHCHLTKRTKKADMERNLVGIYEEEEEEEATALNEIIYRRNTVVVLSGDIICSVTRREYFHRGISQVRARLGSY